MCGSGAAACRCNTSSVFPVIITSAAACPIPVLWLPTPRQKITQKNSMAQTTPQKSGRSMERVFLLLIGCLMAVLFLRLFAVLKLRYEDVAQRLADGTLLNLNAKDPGAHMKTVLEKGYYFEDERDIAYISSVID